MSRITIRVRTYSGHRADERPVCLVIGDAELAVVEVLDRWYGPDHSYFKLLASNRKVFIVRHDAETDTWELVMMEDPERAG